MCDRVQLKIKKKKKREREKERQCFRKNNPGQESVADLCMGTLSSCNLMGLGRAGRGGTERHSRSISSLLVPEVFRGPVSSNYHDS